MTQLAHRGPDPVLEEHAALVAAGALPAATDPDGVARLLRDDPPTRRLSAQSLDAWQRELEALDLPDAAWASFRALRSGEAWVVVTGQQAGVLTGPYLTIAKAVHTIQLARELTQRCDRPVVPVFWIASDDHDLAEVQTTHVVNAARQVQRLRLELGELRAAVSEVRLPESASSLARQVLEAADAGDSVEAWMEARPGESLSRWFARLLVRLLGSHGLLPVEPATLLEEGRGLLRDVLEDPEAWNAAFRAGTENVRGTGLDAPLPDEGRLPLFLITERDRRRVGVDPSGRWQAGDVAIGEDDIDPLSQPGTPRWSPDAALRPLLQNAALPVAAYVAGPTEVRYWAQLGPAHQRFGVRFPAVVPRMSVRLLPRRIARVLRKLGLPLEEGLALLEQAESKQEPPQLRDGDRLQHELEAWVESVSGLDPGVERAIARRVDQLLKNFGLTLEQARSSWAERRKRSLDGSSWLSAYLEPRGSHPEQLLNVMPFYAEQGDGLIDQWMSLDLSCRRWTLLLE